MSHELLERSMQAYRDEHPGAALDANAIRRRVLLRAGTRRRRRLVLLRLGVPLAATFFVSVALAASQVPFPRFDEVRRWLGGEAPQATAGGPVSGRPPNRARAPVLPPPQVSTPLPPRTSSEVAPVPEPPAVPEPERGSPALRLRVERRKNATVPDVAPSNARGVPDTRPNLLKDDLAIYRRAHQLHFHGGAPASALRAWDAYLIAYPAGTFAPEARFNRAVCLLRLGRRAEAKAILEPIAESSFAYGRERARALLGAME